MTSVSTSVSPSASTSAASREDRAVALHSAAFWGNIEELKQLMANGVDLNDASSGRTPLISAVRLGQLDAVKFLVENKAEIDQTYGDRKTTALYDACANGFVSIVEYLLTKGADVNKTNSDGWTPLMVAVTRCLERTVDTLIEHKADTHAKIAVGEDKGKTALDLVTFPNPSSMRIRDRLSVAPAPPAPPAPVPTITLATTVAVVSDSTVSTLDGDRDKRSN